MDEKKNGGEKKKNGDGGDKKKEDNSLIVVLKVDMHYEGCASKIVKTVKSFDGQVYVSGDSSNFPVKLFFVLRFCMCFEKLPQIRIGFTVFTYILPRFCMRKQIEGRFTNYTGPLFLQIPSFYQILFPFFRHDKKGYCYYCKITSLLLF